MTESIPELVARRMGERRVKSLRALHQQLPVGVDSIAYETVRDLANGKQCGTRDQRVYRDLSTILAIDENVVRAAMGAAPTFGEWEMPARAQGLEPHEREIVISVVDALLRAKRGGCSDGRQPDAEKMTPPQPQGGTITTLTPKQQRMVEDAQPMESAAYDGEDSGGKSEAVGERRHNLGLTRLASTAGTAHMGGGPS